MANRSGAGPRARDGAATGARAAPATPWHALALDDVCTRLGVDPSVGLDPGEAAARVLATVRTRSASSRRSSALAMLADQFADFMIVVLIVAAVISGIVGDVEDTLAIVVIVLLNAVIGFVQEYRAERAMAALRQMAAGSALVVRGGETLTVPAADVVPGDVVVLEAGNVVPADLRLVDAPRLKIDEALLTGESVASDKHCAVARARRPARSATAATSPTRGRSSPTAAAAASWSPPAWRPSSGGSPRCSTRASRRARRCSSGWRCSGGGSGSRSSASARSSSLVGLLRGEPPVLLFLTAISLAVAAIPEALPAVVTISLALGAGKMARQHALIRRLPAVETLGSVTVICSDKTGTLTQNRMRAVALHVGGERDPRLEGRAATPSPARTLLTALALCNDATRSHHGHVTGDPTEVALCEAAHDAGFDKAALEAASPRIHELPFDSERKRMTTVHRAAEPARSPTRRARPSGCCRCARRCSTADGERPLPRDGAPRRRRADGGRGPAGAGGRAARAARSARGGERPGRLGGRRQARASASPSASEAARARAAAEAYADANAAAIESALVFVGLVGLIDPPRREAKDAVALCGTAGITPVMITGDHPATALAVARELGIAADAGADALRSGARAR